jgi:hypothetical protein
MQVFCILLNSFFYLMITITKFITDANPTENNNPMKMIGHDTKFIRRNFGVGWFGCDDGC